jgi:hypothetical protein
MIAPTASTGVVQPGQFAAFSNTQLQKMKLHNHLLQHLLILLALAKL